MPLRVWVFIGMAVAVVAVAYIALTIAAPRDGADEGATPVVGAAADAPNGEAAPAGAALEPAPEPLPDAVDPALVADLEAIAATRALSLPEVQANATLIDVSAEGENLTFTFMVPIDIDTVQVSDPLPPAIESYECDEDICFRASTDYVRAGCADVVFAGLIDRGAWIRFDYRDGNQRPVAVVSLSRAACGG